MYLFKLIGVFWFFFGYAPRSEIAGSYDGSNFSVLRHFHLAFRSSCANVRSHQQCQSAPLSSPPHQHLLSLVSFADGHSDRCEVITSNLQRVNYISA